MTTNPLPTQLLRKRRLLIVGVASTILVLEIIFSFFGIPKQQITPSDVMGLLVVLILILARPKMFQLAFRARFNRLPLIYKVSVSVAVYVLVVKAAYFLGYFWAVFFKDCPPPITGN